MAAAIQHAAGGALLGAASSPAAADFTWRAVAAAAPRLLRVMQQRHVSSSAPRALHTLLHRPSLSSASGAALRRPAASASGASSRRLFHSHVHRPAGAVAGSGKQMPATMMGASRGFSTHDKYTNQLEEEEAKLKRKKALATALMNDIPKAGPGAADNGEEIGKINDLFGLLDVADANSTPATTNNDAQFARQLDGLRSVLEKKKNVLLIELLKDGDDREAKKAELVEAGRRLREALVAHDERRAFQNLFQELKSLQKRVASAEHSTKTLSDKVAAGRREFESANAMANSIRADVSRLGVDVTSLKTDTAAARIKAENASTSLEWLEDSVGRGRKEAEAAYGLALFVGCTTVVGAGLAALNFF